MQFLDEIWGAKFRWEKESYFLFLPRHAACSTHFPNKIIYEKTKVIMLYIIYTTSLSSSSPPSFSLSSLNKLCGAWPLPNARTWSLRDLLCLKSEPQTQNQSFPPQWPPNHHLAAFLYSWISDSMSAFLELVVHYLSSCLNSQEWSQTCHPIV